MARAFMGRTRQLRSGPASAASRPRLHRTTTTITTTTTTTTRSSSSSSSTAPPGPAPTAPTPLSLRPASFVASLGELLEWRATTQQHIERVAPSFQADDGPDRDLLMREVEWVLDDTVAELQAPGGTWAATTWRALSLEAASAARRGSDAGGWQVRTRATPQQLARLWQRRLEERVPFQYLISSAHWRQWVLSVGPGVLVPRPETELMVDLAAAALAASPALAALPWADLGTGSGAIAIGVADALRRHTPAPQVWAVERSEAALPYARFNVQLTGSAGAVTVVQGSWYEPLQHLAGRLGGIVSNPPYIPQREMAGLQREVGAHEPASALLGGDGPGMDSLQVICSAAPEMLAPGGFLALETAGGEQAEAVAQLLRQLREAAGGPCFAEVQVVADCYGRTRFVTATRV